MTGFDLSAGRSALMSGSVGAQAPFTVARAKGCTVWDTEGKEYLDFTAQAWSLSIGHAHPVVIDAVVRQLQAFSHIRTSFDTECKLNLAAKLARLPPTTLKRVSFCLSGSDAVEGAMKLAMRNRESQAFVALDDGFHGRTLAAMSLSWPHPGDPFRAWSGPVTRVPQAYCYRCPLGLSYPSCRVQCVDAAKDTILRSEFPAPAAIVMEPVQGNGGMISFPHEYLQKMRALADELGSLLIWDEIQTGMGRVGAWSCAELYNVTPDILILGKGLGGGLPLFSCVSREDLKSLLPGDHSFTFAHFPLSMAAALATISVIESEALLGRAVLMGARITGGLRRIQQRVNFMGDIRGPGLMIGVEIVKSRETKTPDPELSHKIVVECLRRGLLLGESKYAGLGNVLKFKPPLIVSAPEVDKALEIFESVVLEIPK